jgi:hypothetical protein
LKETDDLFGQTLEDLGRCCALACAAEKSFSKVHALSQENGGASQDRGERSAKRYSAKTAGTVNATGSKIMGAETPKTSTIHVLAEKEPVIMRAYRYDDFGSLDRLRIHEEKMPQPQRGEKYGTIPEAWAILSPSRVGTAMIVLLAEPQRASPTEYRSPRMTK